MKFVRCVLRYIIVYRWNNLAKRINRTSLTRDSRACVLRLSKIENTSWAFGTRTINACAGVYGFQLSSVAFSEVNLFWS